MNAETQKNCVPAAKVARTAAEAEDADDVDAAAPPPAPPRPAQQTALDVQFEEDLARATKLSMAPAEEYAAETPASGCASASSRPGAVSVQPVGSIMLGKAAIASRRNSKPSPRCSSDVDSAQDVDGARPVTVEEDARTKAAREEDEINTALVQCAPNVMQAERQRQMAEIAAQRAAVSASEDAAAAPPSSGAAAAEEGRASASNTATPSSAVPLTATTVDEPVMATATKDTCYDFLKRNRRAQVGLCVAMLAIIGLIVGAALTIGSRGEDDVGEPEEFFAQVGNSIDGEAAGQMYGISLSMNEDGTYIAAADLTSVQVYRLDEGQKDEAGDGDDRSVWTRLGQPLRGEAPGIADSVEYWLDRSDGEKIGGLRSPIVAKISASGEFLAIGWPLYGSFLNAGPVGLVEVYRFVGDSWVLTGIPLRGVASGDYFGFDLDLNEAGDVLAVGAAGNGGYAAVYTLNDKEWILRKDRLTDAALSIYSISMSSDGRTVAVGGIPTDDGAAVSTPVARIFKWVAGGWEERGTGILGVLENSGNTTNSSRTTYLAKLSGDGKTVVVSNYYTTDASTNTGLGLDVRAFAWDHDGDDWQLLGDNMHAGYTAEKSGYFISVSKDGRAIGMGDPGRRSRNDGGATGHAHIFEFDDDVRQWVQVGPNIDGEAAGDQFGFALAVSGDGKRMASSAPFSRSKTGQDMGRVQVFTY